VNEVRVNGASDNLTAGFSEVFGVVAELDDFCGADECEVKGIEEEDKPLVLVVLEGELFELIKAGDPGGSFEEGGSFANDSSGDLSSHKICFQIIDLY